MRIGLLRNRVTVQQRVETRNEFGEVVVTWETFAVRWAQVEDLRGREFWEAQQMEAAEVTTRVRIRHTAGVEPDMRVVHDSRTLEIVAVLDPEGRRRQMELMCRELTPDG